MADNYIVNYVKGVVMALIATLMAFIGQNLNKPKPVAYPPSFPGAKAIKKEDYKGNGVLYDAYLVDVDVYRKYAPNGGKTTSAPIPAGDPVDGFPIFTIQYGYEAQGSMYSDGLIRGIVEDVFSDEVDPRPEGAQAKAARLYGEMFDRNANPDPIMFLVKNYGLDPVKAEVIEPKLTPEMKVEAWNNFVNLTPYEVKLEWAKDMYAKLCGGVWTPPTF